MAKILPFSHAPTAEDEARQWVIRIDRSKLSVEERSQLHQWLAADPRHGELLDLHAKLWHAAEKARAPARPARAAAANTSYWVHGGRAAGVALACAAALAVWYGPFGAGQDKANVLQTAAGQHQRYAASDGSHIELNTRSKAIVNYAPRQRQVELVSGEGFFEVAKDKNRPFTVVAGSTTVQAIGTRFSVHRRANGQVDVVVSEGVVQVTQRDGKAKQARLEAGQALAARPDRLELEKLTPVKVAQRLAWQQGRVTFDETPLSSALEEVSRYAVKPITLGDARAASVKVSGSFSTTNIDAFLRTLELGFGLKVENRPKAYVVVSAGKA